MNLHWILVRENVGPLSAEGISEAEVQQSPENLATDQNSKGFLIFVVPIMRQTTVFLKASNIPQLDLHWD